MILDVKKDINFRQNQTRGTSLALIPKDNIPMEIDVPIWHDRTSHIGTDAGGRPYIWESPGFWSWKNPQGQIEQHEDRNWTPPVQPRVPIPEETPGTLETIPYHDDIDMEDNYFENWPPEDPFEDDTTMVYEPQPLQPPRLNTLDEVEFVSPPRPKRKDVFDLSEQPKSKKHWWDVRDTRLRRGKRKPLLDQPPRQQPLTHAEHVALQQRLAAELGHEPQPKFWEKWLGRNVGPLSEVSTYEQAVAEGPISVAAWYHDLQYDQSRTLDDFANADREFIWRLDQVPEEERDGVWHLAHSAIRAGLGKPWGYAYNLIKDFHDMVYNKHDEL